MPTVSLVLCTRDPDPAILARVLRALVALRVPAGWARDGVLVDNGSRAPLATLAPVREALAQAPWLRVVDEPRPGLAAAREAGVRATTGEWLVWSDDDTELAVDYLEGLAGVVARAPDATVLGAGRIVVEYVEPVPDWVRRIGPPFHLSRDDAEAFSADHRWGAHSPVGAGMVTHRRAIMRWEEGRQAGRFTMVGRRGRQLGAGEDAQMQYAALQAGERVGVSPAMRLQHLIPARRTTMHYLARLTYGTSATIYLAQAEVFGAGVVDSPDGVVTWWGFVRAVARTTVRHGWRLGVLNAASWLGGYSGLCVAHGRPVPWWIAAGARWARLG